MNRDRYPQYRIASTAAAVGLVVYGFMRFFEGSSLRAWGDPTLAPFYLSLLTAALVVVEHLLLRRFEFMPLVTITTMCITMTIGAYISTDWDYYYLAMLGMTGIMCLYGQIRPLVVHQVLNVALTLFILTVLLHDAPEGYVRHMLISSVLYLYASLFLILQFYRANKKESAADSGLQAFSSLLGSTPNLMVIVDNKRRVRYISAPLAKFAGMDEKVAIGRPLVDLFKADSLKLMFADILDAESFYSATREIDMNNEPHYYKIIADKLSDSDDGMFIEITDMTEIVLASMEAEKARREAEAANKSKSAFLTTMSHEIRTPMNAIIGLAEIQLLKEELPEDSVLAFRQIHLSGRGLLGIINDILDLSKIETGRLEITPVEYNSASLIHDAVQLNIVRIGSKPIAFSLSVSDSLPARMVGDEMRIKQILNNILSNAFKYTDEGSVSLSVSHRAVEDGIELTFVITDTGQGMRPEDLDRLFEEYSRFNLAVNRATEGTGLGMTITRRLVHMMHGSIEVESEYGVGSTFTVTILQQPSADPSVIGAEYAEKLRNFTYALDREVQSIHLVREHMPYGRVLVVDDAETNLYVAKGLLAPYGLTVETAASGFEAIEKIEGGAVYDIVFMDHMMPRMDGVETAEKLREGGYRGPIVALTANAIAGNDKFFKAHGFADFISKPIDLRQMNEVLNRYIRDRQSPETLAEARAQADTQPSLPPAAGVDRALLSIFKRDARRAIATLAKSRADGDFKLFSTTAHAMKSACANIGLAETAALAEALEHAGNRGDSTFIDAHAPGLIDTLRGIVGAETADETTAPETEDTALLRETLGRFRVACEAYDGAAARRLLRELEEQSWRAETAAALEALSEMVLCSDFEEAAQKAAEL